LTNPSSYQQMYMLSYIISCFKKSLHSESLSLVKDHWWQFFVNARRPGTWFFKQLNLFYLGKDSCVFLGNALPEFLQIRYNHNKLNFVIDSIVRIVKSRKLWWTELIAQVGGKENTCRIFGETSGNVATWKNKEIGG
jgi:hypothetical protein